MSCDEQMDCYCWCEDLERAEDGSPIKAHTAEGAAKIYAEYMSLGYHDDMADLLGRGYAVMVKLPGDDGATLRMRVKGSVAYTTTVE